MYFLIEDIKRIFIGKIEYILFSEKNACQFNAQSCDCDSVLIKTKNNDKYIFIECKNETFAFKDIASFDSNEFCLKHTPPNDANIIFVNAWIDEKGIEGLKFRYADRYLFFFASEDDELIVTISKYDLFEEDDTPIPNIDDSKLTLKKIE